MHGLQVSSQVVSLRTSASERAFHLGLLTLSYGIGLVIGGLAGGFIALELRSNRMAALFSVVLSGAALIVSQLAIPAIVPTSGERHETATEIFARAMALLKDTLKHTKSSLLLLFFVRTQRDLCMDVCVATWTYRCLTDMCAGHVPGGVGPNDIRASSG